MDDIKREKSKKWNIFLYFSVITANLSSFTLGVGYTWSSSAIPRLNGQINPEDNPLPYNITPYEESWIASLLALGAAISAFISGYLADRIGRKYTLLASNVPTIIGYFLLAFGDSVPYLYVGRFLTGLGCGTVMIIVPIYVGEISEKSNRGALGCVISIQITLGCLFVFFVAPYVKLKMLSIACLIVPLVFLFLFGIFVPESPYYYVKKNKISSAEASLLKLRYNSEKIVKEELPAIVEDIEDSFGRKINFRELFRDRAIVKSSIIAFGLVSFQQWSGINAVYFYLQSIFEESGSGISSDNCVIIVGILQFLASLFAVPLADRFGRRMLLLSSSLGVGLSLLATGIYFYLKEFTEVDLSQIRWFPLVTLILFYSIYNMGFGPMSFTMIGELFPPHTKAMTTTISIFLCLLSTFLCATVFPIFKVLAGLGMAFCFLGVISVLASVFIFFVVPETKGKTLQEVQELLKS